MKPFPFHITDYAERDRHRLAYILWLETTEIARAPIVRQKKTKKIILLAQAD